MRQAVEDAAGAGGGRAARSPAGALRPDPAAGRRGGRGAGSAGPRPLAAQPPARTHSRPRVGDPQSASLALDLAPDVFVMRVLLEETSEVFRVTNCRGDMTVLELKEELDLIAGIPLNLQRLQYLDQGGPCPTLPSPCVLRRARAPSLLLSLCPRRGPCPMRNPDVKTNSKPPGDPRGKSKPWPRRYFLVLD